RGALLARQAEEITKSLRVALRRPEMMKTSLWLRLQAAGLRRAPFCKLRMPPPEGGTLNAFYEEATMKRNPPLLFIICLLAIVCPSWGTRSAAGSNTASDAEKRLQAGNRSERQGWIYVHLEGAPDKIGYQHGSLLSKEIEDLLRVMKPFLERQSKRGWNFY